MRERKGSTVPSEVSFYVTGGTPVTCREAVWEVFVWGKNKTKTECVVASWLSVAFRIKLQGSSPAPHSLAVQDQSSPFTSSSIFKKSNSPGSRDYCESETYLYKKSV